eukprot:1458009-Amphidinium_carterae.1
MAAATWSRCLACMGNGALKFCTCQRQCRQVCAQRACELARVPPNDIFEFGGEELVLLAWARTATPAE